MGKYMIGSRALQMTFLFIACFIWLGIWLTGFQVVHWLLYVPAVFLVFAGITGICPGLIISRIIFREKIALSR